MQNNIFSIATLEKLQNIFVLTQRCGILETNPASSKFVRYPFSQGHGCWLQSDGYKRTHKRPINLKQDYRPLNSMPLIACVHKHHRQRIDAIALTCGRWAIGEDMAQMGITSAATHFFSHHAVAAVDDAVSGFRLGLGKKGWPTAMAVEFGLVGEQQCVTTCAAVIACFMKIIVTACIWAFSPSLTRYIIHVVWQQLAPFGIGFVDFFHGDNPFYRPSANRYTRIASNSIRGWQWFWILSLITE